jgi:transposase
MDLALSAGERRRLGVAMKQAVRARLYRRLQAVLLVGEGGRATKEVAAITGASWRSVQHWCRAWRRSATGRRPEQVLAEKPHRGRPRGVCALSRRRLLAELAKDPLALGYAATNWTVPLLARHLQRRGLPITARTLRRRLHAAGLRWKRPRYVFAAPEPRTYPRKKGSHAPLKALSGRRTVAGLG